MMKDYSVQVKIRNNYLLTVMRRCGFETAAELARASGANYQHVVRLLSLTIPAQGRRGEWNHNLLKLSKTLKTLPEDLVPPQHHNRALKKNTGEIEASLEEVGQIAGFLHSHIAAPDCEMETTQAIEDVSRGLAMLSPREERILRLRFGFNGEAETLEKVADKFSVSRDRILQIEASALRKLRHPSRSRRLKDAAESLGVCDASCQDHHTLSVAEASTVVRRGAPGAVSLKGEAA